MYVFCLLILFGMFVVDGGDNSCLYVWMVYWFDSLGVGMVEVWVLLIGFIDGLGAIVCL